MVSIMKSILFTMTLAVSASAYTLPTTIPRSVRDLVKTAHQFHASVDIQLDAAEERLKLLDRELIRQKTRKRMLISSLRSSLLRADLSFDESRNACNAVRNYNRSMLECERLPEVEERVLNLTEVCNAASDPGTCFEDRVVGFQVLKMIFQLRCDEVEKQKLTIETTMMVCAEQSNRAQDRLRIRSAGNPVVMELKGVLIGLNILQREIKMVEEQIEAYTPYTTPTPEPEYSPYYVQI